MHKNFYLLISLICSFLLGFALFIQHQGWLGVHYPPCPLCILQRIAFLGLFFSCINAFLVILNFFQENTCSNHYKKYLQTYLTYSYHILLTYQLPNYLQEGTYAREGVINDHDLLVITSLGKFH